MKIDSPILRRLGSVPLWRGEASCLKELNTIYSKARQAALEKLTSQKAVKS